MDDLVTFLRARLDEDEAAAKAAALYGGRWRLNPDDSYEEWPASVGEQDSPGRIASTDPEEGAHIARHDPARVLREVEAKRKILAQWEAMPPESPVLIYALHCLAAVYRDHPDYRPEWAD